MDDSKADERPALKPFGQLIHEQRGGLLHDELSEQLASLVVACTETGKKGTLTLKLTISPNKDEVTLLVLDDVAVKSPKPDAKPGLFFFDEHGNLMRRDPRQAELPLRELQGGKDADAPRNLKEAKKSS